MRANVQKIVLDGYGSYLGMEKGCFVVRDKHGESWKYPLFESEIGEVVLRSGNAVSTSALASMGFWGIDVLILTQKGKPIAVLKSLDDDAHVKTRICQYEALKNGKGIEIAKAVVYAKIESQNLVLRKYGLRQHDLMMVKDKINSLESDSLSMLRKRLLPIEGKASEHYFKEIFQLLPRNIRIENRRTFKAYDGINNTFNLTYALLKWKVQIALLKARLEPYLGFLHSEEVGKPSLVCDMLELYRCFAEDFLIQYCRDVKRRDFIVKTEKYSTHKPYGKREYLSNSKTNNLIRTFYAYLDWKVRIPRIRHGYRQSLETLINEESLLFAKYLRNERDSWIPRIAIPN